MTLLKKRLYNKIMTNTLLLTADQILDFVGASEHIEEMYLNPHIRNQQYLEIRPLIGVPLFDYLVGCIETDTLSGTTETLLEHIRPALSYYVLAAAYYDLSYKITRKGIMRQVDDAAEAPSDAMISMKAQQARDLATSFANDLIAWLEDNAASYPLYKSDCTVDTKKRTGSPIFTGYSRKSLR